jgi:hypothetical protein
MFYYVYPILDDLVSTGFEVRKVWGLALQSLARACRDPWAGAGALETFRR